MEISQIIYLLGTGLKESIFMLICTFVFAYLLGLPYGILLFNKSARGLSAKPIIYNVLSTITNTLRSIPFLILMVLLIPLTRAISGTSIGPLAAVVPLTIGTAPFIARMVESALAEVPVGIVEAAKSMGADDFNILFNVLLSEARPSLISGSILVAVNILTYSALAGFIGSGGLGAVAINYGYNRYNFKVMAWTVLVIILLVQVIEALGKLALNKFDHNKK